MAIAIIPLQIKMKRLHVLNTRNIVKTVTAFSKVNVGGEHRLVHSDVSINAKTQWSNLVKPNPNLINLHNTD